MDILRALGRTLCLVTCYMVFAVIGRVLRSANFLTRKRRRHYICKFIQLWARCSCFFFNIHIRVMGNRPPANALIVANHVGSPDIFILGSCFPAFFVSKAELTHWPGVGYMARLGESIFAERQKRHQIKAVNREIQDRLEDGFSVILFAEGQASDGSGVLPFKSSPFQPAVSTRRPVLPVIVRYHDPNTPSVACWHETGFFNHIWKLLKFPKLEASVFILPPIEGESDRRALAVKSHQMIEDIVHPQTGNPP